MNSPLSSNERRLPSRPDPAPKPVAERPIVQQQNARTAFNQKLDDAERRFQAKAIPSTTDRPSGEQWQPTRNLRTSRDSSNSDDLDEDDSGNDQNLAAMVQPKAQAQPILPEALSQAGLADQTAQQQRAYLDRMAAAIAEIAERGNQSIFAVEFGSDVLIAKSAILGWDKNGALSVRLIAAQAGTSPHAVQLIRDQLRERLERRRITVKSIEMEAGDPLLPLKASA
jgi:hypothetical protein